MSLLQFFIFRVDTGFARIVWRTFNKNNERIYYCIQDQGNHEGKAPIGIPRFEMMRCGQPPECEPSHRVAHSGMPLAEMLELPNPHGSKLEQEIREWILRQ